LTTIFTAALFCCCQALLPNNTLCKGLCHGSSKLVAVATATGVAGVAVSLLSLLFLWLLFFLLFFTATAVVVAVAVVNVVIVDILNSTTLDATLFLLLFSIVRRLYVKASLMGAAN